MRIEKEKFQKEVERILAETPGYPIHAAQGKAAKNLSGLSDFQGGDIENGFIFNETVQASPKNVLKRFGAERFPIILDNVKYTLQNGRVYAHSSAGNMSRSEWAKGKPVESIVTGKVIVTIEG